MKSVLSSLWQKLFYSPYFFAIAVRKKGERNILSDAMFRADYVIPATYRKWAADPILIDDQGKTYLFYEAVNDQKGRIEVARVNDDGSVSDAQVVLEDTFHYSYPFVFPYKQEWYMIPESSASGEVRLYKADEFPGKWSQISVLLREKNVDTTVFEMDGVLYMLTYKVCPGTERVWPRAYRFYIGEEEPYLEALFWDAYDELACRGAGPVFRNNDMLIRPAQKNRETSYGDGLLFYRLDVNENTYTETPVGKLDADQIKVKGVWMNGLHTYTSSRNFEAIDIRCREFDLWKIPRYFWNKVRQNRKG